MQELMPQVRGWVQGLEIEPAALNQLRNISKLPILAGPMAVMPDVHMGIGATVGSVIPTKAAVIPSAVGVDIGCGMLAARTQLRAEDLPTSLAKLRAQIERDIPVGFDAHKDMPRVKSIGLEGMKLDQRRVALEDRFQKLKIREYLGRFEESRLWKQCGTLGGGNHFIEVCLDEDGSVWLMLHSGSRNIGKTIGECAINLAKDQARELQRNLPDRDLAWLDEGTPQFEAYIEAMLWAQDYAALNRDIMFVLLRAAAEKALGRPIQITFESVNCHHNFTTVEEHFGERMWITRKGAVRAQAGQFGIIPGSMGTRSYIVRGKGNPMSYCSCSHGAGRRMSRGEAKRLFDLEALKAQTEGVECRKDGGVLDEIPAAYKDIDQVMAAQAELVDVMHTLKQVLCIKG
jgi:tRNA-splicing ligase RtcB